MKRLILLLAMLCLMLWGCGGGSFINDGPGITLTPLSASVLPGGQKQFSIEQAGTFADWSAPDGGTVVDGLFTAPLTNGTYRVVATNIINPLASSTATVTVANVAVTISPDSIVVPKSSVNPEVLTALVSGTANKNVTWSVDGSGGGTVSNGTADGSGNPRATYTAPANPGTFTVRATSQADPSVSGVAYVTVLGSSSLGLSPRTVTLTPGQSVDLTAVLTDGSGALDSTTALTWDVTMNPVGGSLTGSDPRVRTFTVPAGWTGVATCQVRVRNGSVAALATIQVHS